MSEFKIIIDKKVFPLKSQRKEGKNLIFKDLKFTIKKGQFLSLFGPSGCGKTTLINIISGLDKDYLAKPFGAIPLLLAESEYITKLSSICVQCGDLGSFSKRISAEKNQVVVGQTDKYEARCRKCYESPEE